MRPKPFKCTVAIIIPINRDLLIVIVAQRALSSIGTIKIIICCVLKGYKAFQKGFQSVLKGFPRSFKAFQKGFQTVSKGFPKRFKRVSKVF